MTVDNNPSRKPPAGLSRKEWAKIGLRSAIEALIGKRQEKPVDPKLYQRVLDANNEQETDPGFPGGSK